MSILAFSKAKTNVVFQKLVRGSHGVHIQIVTDMYCLLPSEYGGDDRGSIAEKIAVAGNVKVTGIAKLLLWPPAERLVLLGLICGGRSFRAYEDGEARSSLPDAVLDIEMPENGKGQEQWLSIAVEVIAVASPLGDEIAVASVTNHLHKLKIKVTASQLRKRVKDLRSTIANKVRVTSPSSPLVDDWPDVPLDGNIVGPADWTHTADGARLYNAEGLVIAEVPVSPHTDFSSADGCHRARDISQERIIEKYSIYSFLGT